MYHRSQVTKGEVTSVTGGVKGIFRFGMGYNGERFFIGTYSAVDAVSNKRKDVSIESTTVTGKFFAGYRFSLPKKLTRKFDTSKK